MAQEKPNIMGRFRLVLVTLAAVLAVSGCASDSEEAQSASVRTVPPSGAFESQLGGLKLQIAAASIGAAADQVPVGSRLTLRFLDSLGANAAVVAAAPGGIAVSPGYRAALANPNGGSISALATPVPHTIRLFPDAARMALVGPGATPQSLRLVRLVGTATKVLTHGASLVTEERFTVDADGWVVAQVSSLGDFILMSGGTAAQPTLLTGTLSELGGILAFNLSAAGGDSVVVTMPATAIATLPATVAANKDTYNTANPTAATNRGVLLTSSGTQFTSFNTGASATILVTARAGGSSTGLITGTLSSSAQVARNVNYSFTTADAGGSGASLSLQGTRFDISASSTDGHAVAAVHNGTNYVTMWLGAEGAGGRVLKTQVVSPTGATVDASATVDAAASFSGGPRISAAHGVDGATGRIFMVGSNAANQSGSVIGLMLDSQGKVLTPAVEVQVTTAGGEPLVVWNEAEKRFIVAWSTTTGVSVAAYGVDGVLDGAALEIAATANGRVTGLASSGVAEALVVYSNGTGVFGRRFDTATLGVVGTQITFATTGSGGVCAFDSTASAWVVAVETGGNRVAKRMAPGSDTVSAGVNLILPGALRVAAGGAGGVVLSDFTSVPNFGSVFSYQGAAGGTTEVAPHSSPLSPQVTNSIGFPFHDAVGPMAVATDGAGNFMVVASDFGGAGITGIRIRLNPGT